MDWIVAGIIVAIAVGLAVQRSTYLVDYVLVIYVFNRGLRRLLDYFAGSFNPLSPISLTPLIITGLMLLPFLQRMGTVPKSLKTIVYCLLGALAYGFMIGFFRVQFAAIYALGEVLAPVAMFCYILALGAPQEAKDRWLRTAAWCAILASLYGWYQYLTIPPWDAFWVRATKLEGYLGILKPTKISVFSTMAERGVFGGFLGFAIVPMILSPKWRTPLGWVGVMIVVSNILLTQTRTGLILAALSVMIYVMVNRGTGFIQMAVAFCVIGAAAWFGMSKMPGSERLANRYSSLGSMQKDGSYQARLEIYQTSWVSILSNPLGTGLGSTGISGRINTGGLSGQAVVTDAGYIEIFAQYGWIGAALLFYALWRMWQELGTRYRIGLRTPEVMLSRAFLIALIPAVFVANIITQFSILWVVFGSALCPRTLQIFTHRRQMQQTSAVAAQAPAGGQATS